MSIDIREVKDIGGLMSYFSEKLGWKIDQEIAENIIDYSYDYDASDFDLKEEAFAKIRSICQLPPVVDNQKWGVFCIEFTGKRFEISALRKILSGLVPKRRMSSDRASWNQKDLLFLCFWGTDNERTIGIAHFSDADSGLPQLKLIYCAPAVEDSIQISHFEEKLKGLRWPSAYVEVDHERWREEWSEAFQTGYRETIRDASTLTLQLAIAAQNIRNRVLDTMRVETANGYVHWLYGRFKETLINDMTETQFADMYAQTVVYGLFSARCMDETQEDFSAEEAIDCIPSTNPFLKDLMRECLSSRGNSRLSYDELEIGEVVDLLRNTKTEAITQDFGRRTGGGKEDPVIHFYEEFLTAYDKQQKVQRGVFYTPQPIVNFIVRAVDHILKTEFGYEDGLATTETKKVKVLRRSERKQRGVYTEVEDTEEVPAVQILDPATGTGTFIQQTILKIYENFKEKNKTLSPDELKKAWNGYVPNHLLPRINGFELMMAPYAVAHMKLAMVLKETGYDFNSNQRLNVCLTNTLEEPKDVSEEYYYSMFEDDPLAYESATANFIKKKSGINIIIGNPPYSGESANKGSYIMSLMEDYKKEPGGVEKLKEKNPKWINDDYVKFIRYAQKKITDTGEGVVAYICPHGFIDNPTFRGMRWAFIQAFQKVYIIDLHGNAKKKEKCPDGSKDENVFDVQQGVCIFLAIKHKGKPSATSLFHADMYGLRETKYRKLLELTLDVIGFSEVQMEKPHYFFVSKDLRTGNEYLGDRFFAIDELLPVYSMGLVTARDDLCIQDTKEDMVRIITDFSKLDTDIARRKYNLGADVRDWKVAWAQTDIITHQKSSATDFDYVCEVAYRPFDVKYTYYTGTSRGFICFPRYDVLKNLISPGNYALCTTKMIKTGSEWHHVLVADKPADNCYVSNKTGERVYVFPLYITDDTIHSPNINDRIKNEMVVILDLPFAEEGNEDVFSPLSVFCYIYAVLHSETYRKKYFEFLKIGFPRVPYPVNVEQFFGLAKLGKRLIDLHLERVVLDTSLIENSIDNGLIQSLDYRDGKLYINKNSWFSMPESVYTMEIGCYQVTAKWLKDRKGAILSTDDIEHYKQMIAAITETIQIMDEIDQIIVLDDSGSEVTP